MDKQTFFTEHKTLLVALIVFAVLGLVLLLNFLVSSRRVSLVPGANSFNAGDQIAIQWVANNVSRVGIALFNGDQGQWIIQNYPAGGGKYVWQSSPYQEAGENYRIAVFEYPWKNGNPIAYSPSPITIVGQKYVSCDDYSVEFSWPHLSNAYSDIRRIFVTSSSYSGDMGGIEGADALCAKEAEKLGYPGEYIAFLGTDEMSAAERVRKDGVFVEATPAGTLAEGKSCHRMAARNLQDLLDKTRADKDSAEIQLSGNLYKALGNVWYGRRTSAVETTCLSLPRQGATDAFAASYNCQDWTVGKRQIYSNLSSEANLARCYNQDGVKVQANYYGAVASGFDLSGSYTIAGDTCDSTHKLLCVEQ